MELTLLAARLLLAVVFLLAGVSKLRDRQGSSKAFRDFGLPPGLARPLSSLLGPAEIVIAVALFPLAFAWYAACAAFGLLSVFIVGIGVNLARGRKPDCHCFGQLHSAPIGWQTLVRNGILGAAAAWLVSRGRLQIGPSLTRHLALAGENERKLFIFAACIVCFLLFRALRQSEEAEPDNVSIESQRMDELPSDSEDAHELPLPVRPSSRTTPVPQIRPEGPPPRDIVPLPTGAPAPDFVLLSVAGEKRSLGSLLQQGKPVFLVFSSPYCEPCQALAPYIRNWMRSHDESLNIIVLSRGTAKDNMAKLAGLEVSRVLLQRDFELAEAYGCTSTPAAVLVGIDGLIRSDLVVGRQAIEQLISSAGNLSNIEAGSQSRGN